MRYEFCGQSNLVCASLAVVCVIQLVLFFREKRTFDFVMREAARLKQEYVLPAQKEAENAEARIRK